MANSSLYVIPVRHALYSQILATENESLHEQQKDYRKELLEAQMQKQESETHIQRLLEEMEEQKIQLTDLRSKVIIADAAAAATAAKADANVANNINTIGGGEDKLGSISQQHQGTNTDMELSGEHSELVRLPSGVVTTDGGEATATPADAHDMVQMQQRLNEADSLAEHLYNLLEERDMAIAERDAALQDLDERTGTLCAEFGDEVRNVRLGCERLMALFRARCCTHHDRTLVALMFSRWSESCLQNRLNKIKQFQEATKQIWEERVKQLQMQIVHMQNIRDSEQREPEQTISNSSTANTTANSDTSTGVNADIDINAVAHDKALRVTVAPKQTAGISSTMQHNHSKNDSNQTTKTISKSTISTDGDLEWYCTRCSSSEYVVSVPYDQILSLRVGAASVMGSTGGSFYFGKGSRSNSASDSIIMDEDFLKFLPLSPTAIFSSSVSSGAMGATSTVIPPLINTKGNELSQDLAHSNSASTPQKNTDENDTLVITASEAGEGDDESSIEDLILVRNSM